MNVECDGLSASVDWKPTGDRRAPILSYSIQYNTSFTPDTWEDAFKNIPAADTHTKVIFSLLNFFFIIPSLQLYVFQVFSYIQINELFLKILNLNYSINYYFSYFLHTY